MCMATVVCMYLEGPHPTPLRCVFTRDKISKDSPPWGFEPLVSTTRLRLLSSVLLGKFRYTDTTNLTEPNLKLELSFYL